MAHTVSDQSSVIRFIEDSWRLSRIGDQSFDAIAGSILNLFDFDDAGEDHGFNRSLILDPDSGEPVLP